MKARTFSTRISGSGPLHPGKHGRVRLLAFLRGLGWTLAVIVAAAFLLAEVGCAAQRVPDPVVVSVCPPIPVPAKPEPPHVILPAPDAAGNYCLTQAQVNDLVRGIKDLKTYAAQLDAAVTVYNEAIKQQAGTAGRKP